MSRHRNSLKCDNTLVVTVSKGLEKIEGRLRGKGRVESRGRVVGRKTEIVKLMRPMECLYLSIS